MFWGITLESGKKYTQILQRSFHVTMAALGFEELDPDPVYVVVDINNAQYVLCTLQSGKILQQTLDLNFTEGEEVSFSIEGEGKVHLTGYLLPNPNEYELTSDEENLSSSEEEEELTNDESENGDDEADHEDNYEKALQLLKKDMKQKQKLVKAKKKECVTSETSTAVNGFNGLVNTMEISSNQKTKKSVTENDQGVSPKQGHLTNDAKEKILYSKKDSKRSPQKEFQKENLEDTKTKVDDCNKTSHILSNDDISQKKPEMNNNQQETDDLNEKDESLSKSKKKLLKKNKRPTTTIENTPIIDGAVAESKHILENGKNESNQIQEDVNMNEVKLKIPKKSSDIEEDISLNNNCQSKNLDSIDDDDDDYEENDSFQTEVTPTELKKLKRKRRKKIDENSCKNGDNNVKKKGKHCK